MILCAIHAWAADFDCQLWLLVARAPSPASSPKSFKLYFRVRASARTVIPNEVREPYSTTTLRHLERRALGARVERPCVSCSGISSETCQAPPLLNFPLTISFHDRNKLCESVQ